MTVDLNEYPILRTFVSDQSVAQISAADAFYLYQQHWPNIDTSKLGVSEIKLVQELIDTVGNGSFAVST